MCRRNVAFQQGCRRFIMSQKMRYQRRMFNGHRRGQRSHNKLSEQSRRRSSKVDSINDTKNSRLLVYQMNATSIVNKLNLFRSRIYEGKPDVVVVQEDWINDTTVPYKVDGYTWFHVPRKIPRSTSGDIRGGGVSILVRSLNKNIIAQQLATIQQQDDTTEIIRVRLFWWNPGGLTTIEINNIYRPPISSNENDNRSNTFQATNLNYVVTEPNSLCCEVSNYNSGIIICGDFNAHHKIWDKQHANDSTGRSLAKFFDDNNFYIANDGSPTYCTQQSQSAIDLTAYRGQIAIENWSADSTPLGHDHHKILEYEIVSLQAEPLNIHPTDGQETNVIEGINWNKVEWSKFNSTVHNIEQAYFDTFPEPENESNKVHWRAKALYKGIEIACRELPKGKSRNPVPWCTPELQTLMHERNEAWAACENTNRSLSWGIWKDKAEKLEKLCRETTNKYWQDFCSSLDRDTDNITIDNVIQAMAGQSKHNNTGFPYSNVIEDHINDSKIKYVSTNKGKAQVFRKNYANTFKRQRPKTLEEKQENNKMKQRVSDYIKSTISRNDPDATPFSMKELKEAIREIKKKRHKSPGNDGIHNEILVHASSPILTSILLLSNSIWETGTMPRPFLLSIIVPIYKASGKPPEQPNSYRPVALTSCLGKLIERLVTRRLTHRVEKNGTLSHVQSGFRPGRSTVDPLMRLVAEVHQGFEAKPAQRTVVAQLDLSKAYDKVSHLQLLDVFRQLCIPPVYARFYKGFLQDRRFKVRIGNHLSKSGKQEDGVPQGAVSSPLLFILYVEAALRKILPQAEAAGVHVHMYADDLTIWKTGNDVGYLSQSITNFLQYFSCP